MLSKDKFNQKVIIFPKVLLGFTTNAIKRQPKGKSDHEKTKPIPAPIVKYLPKLPPLLIMLLQKVNTR